MSDGEARTTTPRPGHRAWFALAMLKVGTIGFGGGSALIPVMERELVRPGRLSEAEFLRGTVISNLTPGALPVKLAAVSGIQLGRGASAGAAALLVALPGSVLTVGILAALAALGPAAVSTVEFASLGVAAFILFVMAHYVSRILRTSRPAWVTIVVAAIAFLLTGTARTVEFALGLFDANPPGGLHIPEVSALGLVVGTLLVAGVLSVIPRGLSHAESHDGPASRSRGRHIAMAGALLLALAAVVFVVAALIAGRDDRAAGFLGLVAASTLSSFGGGEAYVGVADGFFVGPGIVSAEFFYGQLVPVANALPGPILVKLASGMGFAVGSETGSPGLAFLLSIAAFAVSIALCSVVALGVLAAYESVSHSRFVRTVTVLILPVICGLLATTAVSILESNVRIAGAVSSPPLVTFVLTLAMSFVVAAVKRRWKIPDVVIVVFLAVGSAALLSSL